MESPFLSFHFYLSIRSPLKMSQFLKSGNWSLRHQFWCRFPVCQYRWALASRRHYIPLFCSIWQFREFLPKLFCWGKLLLIPNPKSEWNLVSTCPSSNIDWEIRSQTFHQHLQTLTLKFSKTTFFADQDIIFVVRVVSVSEPTVACDFELQKFVTVRPVVTDTC